MSLHVASGYVGLPFADGGRLSPETPGVDCWGLVLAVYHEQLGISLPDWPISASDHAGIAKAFERERDSGRWQPVATPCDWDVVTMTHRLLPHHFGVWAGGRVLHVTQCMRPAQSVAMTLRELQACRFRAVRYWRYRG